MTSRRPGKAHLLILKPPEQASLIEPEGEWILHRIHRGATVERYGRQWIVGRTEVKNGVLTGRIGFRGAEGMAEVWSEEERDFEAIAVPQGQAAPFALDLRTLRLAIQSRPLLKLNGLIGAIEALLSDDYFRWRVASPRAQMTFTDWRSNVERVTKIRLRVVKPNPHYRGTPNLEALLEQAEAEVVLMELQAESGIDTDATFIVESQEHIDAGYGEAIYRGVSEGRETVFNTKLQTEESYEELDVTLDGEVPHESLKAMLDGLGGTGDTGGDDEDDR